ncbi:histidinol dehydrogenase [Shimia sp. MMG029]|uniref:histidinol dehydrogenase n=1 Tax=Shimia sp. MMG029 TaxID=3021978 RepID=UPI0022FEA2B5|nr:histidinol dehydrogenase [Shimia sp. MMG029]MDA5558226.1 histidinol dehydrogenase [Shimia sp. MMG029]
MAITYLKRADAAVAEAGAADARDTVEIMLARIRQGGEATVRAYARRLDRWEGAIVVVRDEMAEAARQVAPELREAMRYAYDNIRRFAEAQRNSLNEFEVELRPGLMAGQRVIPLHAAGCYVPGGRYSHIASALMSITTARVAGVEDVTAASPPRPDEGIPAAILYAMWLAGADRALALGGVQAVAAMAEGHFGAGRADILVGPGNQYVAEAKRQLFGEVGIDMFAGPTDVLVVADDSADPDLVAWDLVGQAEHGGNSPVWLVCDDQALAEAVMARIDGCVAQLPEPNRSAARQAWAERGEVILCADREEMAEVSDAYAPEHLHVQARDLAWWQTRLRSYGSLFLGERACVTFGDKAAGPNHVLPTDKAARYTGGLSVHKFLKTVTWQRVADEALPELVRASSVISREEGMVGHAISAEMREAQFLRPPSLKLVSGA